MSFSTTFFLATVPVMLDESMKYLEDLSKQEDGRFTYEVIIVDDGSRDGTTKVALNYCKEYGCDKMRVLTLAKNRGKGGAVRMVSFSMKFY